MVSVLTSSAFSKALLFLALCSVGLLPELALAKHAGITRHYKFNIKMQNVTRLCQTKSIVTVNGQFPGPRIIAREGDRLLIKVVNHVQYNVTLHWYVSSTSWFLLLLNGEWWKADTETIINQAMATGGAPNISDAFTLNGLPGPSYNCSAKETFKLKVKPSKTYLLRLINAALSDELFFRIANHTLTVVEADAVYVKPFKTDIVLVTPGQTTNVLLRAKSQTPNTKFSMSARPYATGPASFDNTTTIGVLEYEKSASASRSNNKNIPLLKAKLPQFNDSTYAMKFNQKIRSLASRKFPAKVPKKVDRHFFFTVGLGILPCSKNQTCQGPNNTRPAAAVNNVSFVQPNTALLQAHFFNQSKGVYTPKFPTNPPFKFNYTGTPPKNIMLDSGTKVVSLRFNTSVELVLQDTSILGAESHPLHLHGFNFFVLAQGVGNFDPKKDTAKFNLVDPAERNTVGVPSGGWVAIRFLADNPGVWFMHCHLEVHTSWGLKMAWVVNDGKGRKQNLMPPPADLPKC
ncbi:hypothetical protein V6N13_013815 [Hibiscus sabdariffa]